MKVLITDDSGAMRKVMASFLKNAGYTDLLEAENGVVAWQLLEANPRIGLILLDVNMPGMDGHAFLTKLRAHPAYNQIKVVMITTDSERHQVIKALKIGVEGYIIKPINLERFKEVVFPLINGQEPKL